MLFGVVGCSAPGDVDATAEVVKHGGSAMEMYVGAPTRTSNDGIYTLWNEGDRINIFHSLSGENDYINDGAFLFVDGAENRFNGKLNESGDLIATNNYDWYAIYPYNPSLSSPSGEGASYVIASLPTSCQVQKGNNSTSHIAGGYMPLVGVVSGVAADDVPSISTKNVASMVEVVLKNDSEQEVTVKSISFSVSGCNLVGSFNIDFSKSDNIVCTPVLGEVSNVAMLKVESGESIPTHSQASFYVAVAPFVAKSGEVITFDITLLGPEGEKVCSKSQTLTSDVTFHSGKSKPVALNYDQELNIVEIPAEGLPPMQGGGQSKIFRTRTMSYNVRNCKGTDDVIDYKRVADVIATYNTDAVALQELDSMTTRYQNQDVLKNLADYTNMYPTFGAARDYKGGKYGVGVLTKEKPLSHYCVPLPCSSEPRVMLIVELENYYFCSTHFSLLAEYRVKAAEIIIEEAKKLDKPMIIAGDLNAQHGSEPIEMLSEHFYFYEKSGVANTFPAGAPTKEIDFIALYKDRGAEAVVNEHWVPYAPVASDHRPVIADFTICE